MFELVLVTGTAPLPYLLVLNECIVLGGMIASFKCVFTNIIFCDSSSFCSLSSIQIVLYRPISKVCRIDENE